MPDPRHGKGGLSDAAIARQLGRARTTVWRGVRRNPGKRGQRHGQAQGKAEARRVAPSVPGGMTPELWRVAGERLAAGWSPEWIPGRLRPGAIRWRAGSGSSVTSTPTGH